MFREEQVEAYKSITAPDEMRKRVMDACAAPKKKSGKSIYKYSSIAACLAIIIAVYLVFGGMGSVSVSFNGTAVTESGVPVVTAASAMSRSATGIALEAELDGKTVISASEGNVYVNGQLLEGEIDAEKVTVIWDIVPTDTEKTYILTFENSRGATEITLLFNETAGWMLCCDK